VAEIAERKPANRRLGGAGRWHVRGAFTAAAPVITPAATTSGL
jgi:hypothetical protein